MEFAHLRRYVLGRWPHLSANDRALWSAPAALGEPVTVQAGGTVDLALPDKTVDAARVAAKLGVSLERGLFDW
jgi:hypothetical protein